MWKSTFIQGRMGITVMAMSAIDIALWDCLGKNTKLASMENLARSR
jgi:L-alanine-DL-glutamate epimerase-like enolase superfamily enzyme